MYDSCTCTLFADSMSFDQWGTLINSKIIIMPPPPIIRIQGRHLFLLRERAQCIDHIAYMAPDPHRQLGWSSGSDSSYKSRGVVNRYHDGWRIHQGHRTWKMHIHNRMWPRWATVSLALWFSWWIYSLVYYKSTNLSEVFNIAIFAYLLMEESNNATQWGVVSILKTKYTL